jgi:hypothetical protein
VGRYALAMARSPVSVPATIMRSSLRGLALTLVLVTAAGTVSVGQASSAAPSLRSVARGLVAPGNRILGEHDDVCVAGAPFPSCVAVVFSGLPLTFAERRRRAVTRARRQGWAVSEDVTRYGDYITVSRGRAHGFISLYRHPAASCAGMRAWKCINAQKIDVLQITRG